MALALKTCLPLWVSFCARGFHCHANPAVGETPSRVLNINPGPGGAICFEGPPKAVKKTVSLESQGGEVGYLIHVGGKGYQSKKLKLEDFRERKRKKPFSNLPFNY